MKSISIRLNPHQDLKFEIDALAKKQVIKSACVLTCVGSLQQVAIRFANQSETKILNGRFEIVSLVGTLSIHGSHLHIAVADETGKMIGGHLINGSIIFTTAEIVLGVLDNVEFLRVHDESTGYKELMIKPL